LSLKTQVIKEVPSIHYPLYLDYMQPAGENINCTKHKELTKKNKHKQADHLPYLCSGRE